MNGMNNGKKQSSISIDKKTQSLAKKNMNQKQVNKSNETKRASSNLLGYMSDQTIELCEDLTISKRFDEKKFYQKLNDYINNKNRLLYSDISNYIFSIGEEKLKIFEVNLQKVVDYSLDSKEFSAAHIPIIKLWDHCNLAKRQLVQLRQSDDEFTEQFNCKIAPFKQEFTK